MRGAREFCRYFKSGQYGRLYIVKGYHARGSTFGIWVLEKGYDIGTGNGGYPDINRSVKVYGVVSGQIGWTEAYGWLEDGPWKEDFYKLLDEKKEQYKARKEKTRIENDKKKKSSDAAKQAILSSYKESEK